MAIFLKSFWGRDIFWGIAIYGSKIECLRFSLKYPHRQKCVGGTYAILSIFYRCLKISRCEEKVSEFWQLRRYIRWRKRLMKTLVSLFFLCILTPLMISFIISMLSTHNIISSPDPFSNQDISTWIVWKHLKLKIAKTELIFPQKNLSPEFPVLIVDNFTF